MSMSSYDTRWDGSFFVMIMGKYKKGKGAEMTLTRKNT